MKEKCVGDTPYMKKKSVMGTTGTPCPKEKCVGDTPYLKEKILSDTSFPKEKCVGHCSLTFFFTNAPFGRPVLAIQAASITLNG